MQVRRLMKVSAEELFQIISDSAKYEVEHFTKGKTGEHEIGEGLAYAKVLRRGKKSFRTIVKITGYKPPVLYQTRIKSADGKIYEMTYQIEDRQDRQCLLTYTENTFFDDGTPDNRLRIYAYGWLSAFSIKRKFAHMEKAIIKRRKTSGNAEETNE